MAGKKQIGATQNLRPGDPVQELPESMGFFMKVARPTKG
jgi:hypothetical protein